jgi:glycosyltransferase involved in cell wall biosynthesis
MNIAFLIEQSYDTNSGGVQRSTSKLAQIFKSFGHEVIVVSLNNQQKDEVINGVNIYTVNAYETLNRDKLIKVLNTYSTDCIINQAGYSMKITRLLIDIRRKTNFKIINTLRINPLNFITNHELFISQFLKSKKLAFFDSVVLRALILKYHKLKQAYELNFIIKKVNAFVMLSERFKSELYQISPQLKQYEDKIHGISNPFSIPDFQPEDLIKENVVLFVGRLNITQKRTDLLLQVWKQLHHQLPDWNFWVVGHGPEKQHMMDFCKTHKLDRVQFFGQCDPNPYYQKAKLFHMTSAFEGFGNVLVEAQSFGCVPLMFNSYSAAQDIVLDQETGVLIQPFNIDDYVEETLRLITDKDRLNKYAKTAIKHSLNYSYESTYAKWESVFKVF